MDERISFQFGNGTVGVGCNASGDLLLTSLAQSHKIGEMLNSGFEHDDVIVIYNIVVIKWIKDKLEQELNENALTLSIKKPQLLELYFPVGSLKSKETLLKFVRKSLEIKSEVKPCDKENENES